MAEPWQQWYPHKIDKWLASAEINALSDAAYRAVHILLMAQFQAADGMLPGDEREIAKLSRRPGSWKKVRQEVLSYFTFEGGRYFHPVMLEEWRHAKKVSEVRREARSKRSSNAQQTANNSKSFEDTVTETVTETKKEQPITPSMVARGVLEELGLAGRQLMVNLEQVCKSELSAGRDATELRDTMVKAWRYYQEAIPRLSFSSGAEKFFGEGKWRDKSLWPWKEGCGPPPKRIAGPRKRQQWEIDQDAAREQYEADRARAN